MKKLSRKDIENIAERVIKAYMQLPSIKNSKVCRIEPELLAQELLGLDIEYEHLSLDKSVLGLTAYCDTEVTIYDETGEPIDCLIDNRTVLIERDLQYNLSQTGRKNFTIMHEIGHQILNLMYPKDGNDVIHYCMDKYVYKRNITDWEEWQADTLAAALLMPVDILKQGMYYVGFGEKVYCINRIFHEKDYKRFCSLANFLGVSKKALSIRMLQLGLLEKEYLENPNEYLIIYPEVQNDSI